MVHKKEKNTDKLDFNLLCYLKKANIVNKYKKQNVEDIWNQQRMVIPERWASNKSLIKTPNLLKDTVKRMKKTNHRQGE